MRFGDKFLASQHPSWASSYIDYKRLKELIYFLFDNIQAVDGNSDNIIKNPSLEEPFPQCLPGISTSDEFQNELNKEVQKALLFLLGTLGDVATDLSELSEDFVRLSVGVKLQLDISDLLQKIQALRMQFIDRVGSRLLLLLEFVELNVEAINKIVKKHDKLVARWEATSEHNFGEDSSRYKRLRTQYLPRFAVYSSNANVRCLFLIATDAGDIRNNSKEHSSFGGWTAIQSNFENSGKWKKGLPF